MIENPYKSPSAESSAQQTAFVKANQVKACPSCGKDVGLWPFIKAAFSYRSNRIECSNCGSFLECQGTAGRVFGSMQMLMIGMAGGRAVYVGFTQNWVNAGTMVLVGLILLTVMLFCLAPYVRKESTLEVVKSDVIP